ncbi:hypothetical protein [Pedobacter agri]|uniref:hypothetical protein n=1 Tax=Pedobacter agri TaxID=454586 RepID=UPI00292CB46D|nr:hypothetical protein [Pedobacter agri]
MKKIITIAFCLTVFLLGACKTEPDAKAVKKEVLNIHDKLMIDGARVVNNRIKLDAILRSGQIKSVDDSAKIADLVLSLNQADENMMDWMHAFKNDFNGKNEEENLNYFKSEMVKIRAVEDDYIKVTRASDSVLRIYNVKPSDKMEMMHHKR